MKKSLIVISFAFIFLLTMSIVSAGLFITGDVQRSQSSGGSIPTSIEGGKQQQPQLKDLKLVLMVKTN